jgi:ATP-dependent Clp protease adaptor protein ClpS
MSANDPREEEQSGVAMAKPKLRPPKKYKVLMHNDDYTTMEFVVHILQKYFNKTRPEAQAIMLEVHTRGMAVCGIYTYEVAESKVAKITKYARENGHPLKCTMEPCED